MAPAVLALFTASAFATPPSSSPAWPTLGGNEARSFHTDITPALEQPRWLRTHDDGSNPIDWIAQSPPIIYDRRAYAIGCVGFFTYLFAIELHDGAIAWSICIDPPGFDAWAGPTADPHNNTILVSSGFTLEAFDADTGASIWINDLDDPVVNATPVVTQDLGPADRAFLTTFDVPGVAAELLCVNVDPYHPTLNPWKPGDTVWSKTIDGSGGTSPTYHDAVVYVTTTGKPFAITPTPGAIRAYDATAFTAPPPTWTYTLPITQGFFGGLSIHNDDLYAATYAFFGGQNAGQLVSLNAHTGHPRWTVSANRTSSIPIAIDAGEQRLVALAAGFNGFGSVPSIQLFQDLDTHATRLNDTALDTFNDLDMDTAIDPGEYLPLGGWTHHPVLLTDVGVPLLLTGEPDLSGLDFAPHNGLRLLNLAQQPTSPAFIEAASPHGGGSPAVAGDCVVSVGATGLVAFGLCQSADLNHDGAVDIDDLYAFEQSPSDLSGDGLIDPFDRALIERAIRGFDQRSRTR
ncbi:MAG: PQQ-binding-like beta-propeller repeat protein [Planctomycetota bacterium]